MKGTAHDRKHSILFVKHGGVTVSPWVCVELGHWFQTFCKASQKPLEARNSIFLDDQVSYFIITQLSMFSEGGCKKALAKQLFI